ncbi:MAG TPA: CPBP family intramembrane glutamic endopeptidase [Gammaproteobacteria bacterium]|nr:CPBP family intramembrane glutamic endopeptidase [Gammaproteobacteria bacterium]
MALVYLPMQSGVYEVLHLQWNWFGKFLAVVWAVLFLAFGPLSFQDAGVRKPRSGTGKSAAIVVVVLAAVAFSAHWFLSSGAPRSVETLLYQLTMPAIAEELVFRGVLFTVLERAFREAMHGAHWWQSRAVWLTAIAFALFARVGHIAR